jgi:hypothetical protein
MLAVPLVRCDQMNKPRITKATNPTSARKPFFEMSRALRREFCLFLTAGSTGRRIKGKKIPQ